jgi:hypothetical protein
VETKGRVRMGWSLVEARIRKGRERAREGRGFS